MKMSAREVADAIEKHIKGVEGKWDWDDFTSVRIADPYLDKIRLHCIELDSALPEERYEALAKIVKSLRKEA